VAPPLAAPPVTAAPPELDVPPLAAPPLAEPPLPVPPVAERPPVCWVSVAPPALDEEAVVPPAEGPLPPVEVGSVVALPDEQA